VQCGFFRGVCRGRGEEGEETISNGEVFFPLFPPHPYLPHHPCLAVRILPAYHIIVRRKLLQYKSFRRYSFLWREQTTARAKEIGG